MRPKSTYLLALSLSVVLSVAPRNMPTAPLGLSLMSGSTAKRGWASLQGVAEAWFHHLISQRDKHDRCSWTPSRVTICPVPFVSGSQVMRVEAVPGTKTQMVQHGGRYTTWRRYLARVWLSPRGPRWPAIALDGTEYRPAPMLSRDTAIGGVA